MSEPTHSELARRALAYAEQTRVMRNAGIISDDERRYNEGRKHWDTCPDCNAERACPIGRTYL